MSLPQQSLPQRKFNDIWLKLPLIAKACITKLMFLFCRTYLQWARLIRHIFSDSACGRPSVWPTVRHCIRIWLNQPITIQKSFYFRKKHTSKTFNVDLPLCRAQNFIPSYNINVIPTGRMAIHVSKCQQSKITCFGHNFVMQSWIFIWFCQTVNLDELLCRELKTELYQGQGHTKRSTTKESPSSAFSDHNCAMKGLVDKKFGKNIYVNENIPQTFLFLTRLVDLGQQSSL